ncbi:hypothetical protein B484DRAFT_280329 [Ochromonadaceae sp. CCMP2298]|nr:hypothetical protein B484DRAFT_280329 [Ochromonadaceae sp. CCMP2298]
MQVWMGRVTVCVTWGSAGGHKWAPWRVQVGGVGGVPPWLLLLWVLLLSAGTQTSLCLCLSLASCMLILRYTEGQEGVLGTVLSPSLSAVCCLLSAMPSLAPDAGWSRGDLTQRKVDLR